MAVRRLQSNSHKNGRRLPNPNRSSVSPAVGKGKGGGGGGQAILNKVERLHDSALESIEKGGETVKAGFKELLKFIRCHEKYWEKYKKQLRKNISLPPLLPPTWTAMEEFVMIANSEMVLRAAALDFQQDIQWLFHEALRYLGPADQEEGLLAAKKSNNKPSSRGGPSPSRPGSNRSTTSVRSGNSGKSRHVTLPSSDDLSGQPPLKRALKGIVLNNQAVLKWMTQESIPNVIVMLQRALGVSEGGPFSTVILYNLAVCYIASGKFDDAVETVSHCLELANGYLQSLKPPSLRKLEKEEEEKAARDKRITPLTSGRGKGEVRRSPNGRKGGLEREKSQGGSRGKVTAPRSSRDAPKASSIEVKAPSNSGGGGKKKGGPMGNGKGRRETALPQDAVPVSEGELAEIARKRRLVTIREKWRVYSTYVVLLASHSILCHHAIATLAAWCEMEGLEQYHCELALTCAKKYLPAYHYLQTRCKDRLHNVINFALPRVQPPSVIPPQLPLLSLVDFSSSPCAFAAALPDEENPFSGSLSVVANYPVVRISDMLNLIASISKPPEIMDFVGAMVTQALQGPKNATASSIRRSSSTGALPRLGRAGSRGQEDLSISSDSLGPARQRQGSSSSQTKGRRHRNTGMSTKRRKSKGNGETKLPALDRLLPPIHSDPPVAADGHPQHVTVVPRIAYERYHHLKENTVNYLSVAGAITFNTPQSGGDESAEDRFLKALAKKPSSMSPAPSTMLLDRSFRSRSRREGILRSPPTFSRSTGRQVAPTRLMGQYDSDLQRMSYLVKDLLPEVRFRAAQMIQRQWRYFAAHLALERKVKAIDKWKDKIDAASNIMYYYKRWKERFPSIVEARRLRYLQYQGMLLTKVQSFLYQMQSIEEWGRRCINLYQHLLAEKKQREKEATAATMIQSVWRMLSAQHSIEIAFRSVTKIQTQWRCHRARRVLLEKRVHQKLAYEEFLNSVEGKIVYIQRWYRACKSRKAVEGVLEKKRKEINDYLQREEEFFDRELGDLMEDPFLEMKGHKITSVLRGAKIRKELHRQWKARQLLQHVLGKHLLRRQGEKRLAALREEKAIRESQQRRGEEVESAAIQIQCMFRQYQARQRVHCMRECFALMDASASRIQHAYKLYLLRVAIAKESEREKCRDSVHEFSRLRNYASTRIQALWRGHQSRKEQKAFLHFMLIERHQLATKIQCAWRKWRATCTARNLQITQQQFSQTAILHHQRSVAATKIASIIRMYLVRKTLPSFPGYRVIHAHYQRHTAARRIQCAWRCYAAKQYVHQLSLATAYHDMQKVTLEARHAYATLIQALVRGRILNPLRIKCMMGSKANQSTEEEERIMVLERPAIEGEICTHE